MMISCDYINEFFSFEILNLSWSFHVFKFSMSTLTMLAHTPRINRTIFIKSQRMKISTVNFSYEFLFQSFYLYWFVQRLTFSVILWITTFLKFNKFELSLHYEVIHPIQKLCHFLWGILYENLHKPPEQLYDHSSIQQA